MNRLIKTLILGSMATLLSGCIDWVEDTSDLQQWVNQVRSRPAGSIEPLPEYKPYQSFVYKGASLREPFKALVSITQAQQAVAVPEAEKIHPDLERPKEYLEGFALDTLLMVGTIQKLAGESLWALVRDSNGAIHRVREGDYIGLDYGQVQRVEERGIELVEIISNGRGGWMRRQRSLELEQRD